MCILTIKRRVPKLFSKMHKNAFEDLKIIKKVFEQHKVPFLLAYGTLLGAYRDKDFLPGDDDIDLVVVDNIDLRTRKAIGWMLYDLGFKNQQIMFNVFGRMEPGEQGYNGDGKTGIITCERNAKFTIFFFYEDDCETHGKEMVCIPKLGALKLISSPSKFYLAFQKIKFKGETFLTPAPIEDYLAFTYEDWRNPLMRDHGKCFHELHPEYLTLMKNVLDKNEAIKFK